LRQRGYQEDQEYAADHQHQRIHLYGLIGLYIPSSRSVARLALCAGGYFWRGCWRSVPIWLTNVFTSIPANL
jgi:hypothetical protein